MEHQQLFHFSRFYLYSTLKFEMNFGLDFFIYALSFRITESLMSIVHQKGDNFFQINQIILFFVDNQQVTGLL